MKLKLLTLPVIACLMFAGSTPIEGTDVSFTQIGGTLLIDGTDRSDTFFIFGYPDGVVTVEANGEHFRFKNVFRQIVLETYGGHDIVEITGEFECPDGIRTEGGVGDDTSIECYNGADNLYIENVRFESPLLITTLEGSDTIELHRNVIIDGDLDIDTGPDDATIFFSENIDVLGDMTIRTGKSSDWIEIGDTLVLGASSINSLSGNDIVQWSSSECFGYWRVALDAGVDSLHVRNSTFWNTFRQMAGHNGTSALHWPRALTTPLWG